MAIEIDDRLRLNDDEVEITFIRASGPGGQHVNKTSTAAQLRFDAAGSPSLPEAVRARLRRLAGARSTVDGVIVITARRFRSQERNRADAIDRLVGLIRRAAAPPAPRIPTRVPVAQKRKRREAKARRAATKAARAPPLD